MHKIKRFYGLQGRGWILYNSLSFIRCGKKNLLRDFTKKKIDFLTDDYETFVKDQLTDTKVLVLIRRSDETGMLQVQARRHCHQERVHRYF